MARNGSRVREFFQDGGMVAARPGGSVSRMVAGLGLAALVAIVPAEPMTTEVRVSAAESNPAASSLAWERPMPEMHKKLLPREADAFLSAHVAEMIENATIHRYGDYAVPHAVAKAIVRAARETEFPADYLMAIAEKESSFRADATPDAGSARGYFGFIEQTWLSAVKRNGGEYGLADAAAAIEVKKNRRGQSYFDVDDPKLRREIMDLREDPYVSAVMTALDLKDARKRIEDRIDAVMKDEDLYLPHFLGEDAAEDVIAASEHKPGTSARGLLPRAARYNKAMFHDTHGRPLTVAQFRKRAQNVIASRAEKYSEVAGDVRKANLAPDLAEVTASIRKRPTERQRELQDIHAAAPRR